MPMSELLIKIGQNISKNLKDKINIVILLFLVLFTYNLYTFNKMQSYMNETLELLKSAEKKVDFRYFNITRSLQDIHKVEIDTHKGRVTKKY